MIRENILKTKSFLNGEFCIIRENSMHEKSMITMGVNIG